MSHCKLFSTILLLLVIQAINGQNETEFRSDGIIIPRTSKDAVIDPIKGLMIYDTLINSFRYFDGAKWFKVIDDGSLEIGWGDLIGVPAGFMDDVDNVDDGDADPSNEIQTLNLSRGSIILSQSASSISIADISPWTIDGSFALKDIGKVGVGQSIPSARLDVRSDNGEDGLRVRINGATKLRVLASGGTTIGTNPGQAPSNGLYVGGNTGLGTTMANERLQIAGAINLSGSASSENPEAGTIRWNSTTVDFEDYDGANWKSLTGLPADPPPPNYEVGDYEDEGVVFYVSPDGKTVKFVYIGDLETSDWAIPNNIDVIGAESNVDGAQNTLDIINDSSITQSRAEVCYDLVAGGHSDWYLPAINELAQLYSVREIVNDTLVAYLGDEVFTMDTWSSTESSSDEAYIIGAITGSSASTVKFADNRQVRAVRTVTFE